MEYITWRDEDGFLKRSVVPSGETDGRRGIPAGPPDVGRLDWEGIKRDLQNALAERGLWAMEDIVSPINQGGMQGAILSALRRRVVDLYREEIAIGGE